MTNLNFQLENELNPSQSIFKGCLKGACSTQENTPNPQNFSGFLNYSNKSLFRNHARVLESYQEKTILIYRLPLGYVITKTSSAIAYLQKLI